MEVGLSLKDNVKTTLREIASNLEETVEEYETVFSTTAGKELGTNISRLVEFVRKSPMLFFPYESITASKPLLGLMEILPPRHTPFKTEQAIEAFTKLIPEIETLIDEEHIEPAFEPEDLGRFMALLVFSLYAYLDAYSDKLVRMVSRDKGVLWSLLKILEKEERLALTVSDLERVKRGGDIAAAVTIVNRHMPKNLEKKLITVLRAINLKDVLESSLDEYGKDQLVRVFSTFLDVRHTVAHSKPCPDLEFFEERFSREGDVDMLPALEHALTMTVTGAMLGDDLYRIIARFMDQKIPVWSLISDIAVASISFPSLVDAAVDCWLKRS